MPGPALAPCLSENEVGPHGHRAQLSELAWSLFPSINPLRRARGSSISAAGKPCRGGMWETDALFLPTPGSEAAQAPHRPKGQAGQSVQCCCGEIWERERCSGIYGKPAVVLGASISTHTSRILGSSRGFPPACLRNSSGNKVAFREPPVSMPQSLDLLGAD